MMKAGIDVTVKEMDRKPPFDIFNDYSYFFNMSLIDAFSTYTFTFSSIITVWLHENVSPITDEKWIVDIMDGRGVSVNVYFKEEKDAAFFKLTWRA